MTVYSLIVTTLLIIAFYKWTDAAGNLEMEKSVTEKLTSDLDKEVKDSAFLRTSLNAVLGKTINISLTDAHLDHIAYAVAERMKEPKPWQN